MPRFHFEVVDGYTLPDPSGMELPTEGGGEEACSPNCPYNLG